MAAKVYSGRELSAFCLQISILLKAAVPLDEGLNLMAEDAPSEEEKKKRSFGLYVMVRFCFRDELFFGLSSRRPGQCDWLGLANVLA